MEKSTKRNLIIKSGNPHWCLCYMRDNPTEDNTALFGCIVKRGESYIALDTLRRIELSRVPRNYEALKQINKANKRLTNLKKNKKQGVYYGRI